ncbi:MAG: imidazole glycerol phosphate synthase subunit HisH [Acidobacteria bacterium]|nr:imidazole glycerol phosphate synthase subunit HisH [Acidobacteriota bacterium]MBI3426115.1 imidazole glycerol phosphate synthase subunit HisH [Acidobacteriota bacterium]
MKIAIIDYDIGNLRSVEKAFTSQGIPAAITKDEQVIRAADKLVLLGVGAFGYAMDSLRKYGFDKLILEAAGAGKPIIGLCVGLQMLFDEGYEFGVHKGLGLLPGKVIKFPDGVRVPHVGWNQVEYRNSAAQRPFQAALLRGLPDQSFYYFVHSYYVEPVDETCVLGLTDYGLRYASICGRDSVVGVQFHPEKSQAAGLQLLRNFAEF